MRKPKRLPVTGHDPRGTRGFPSLIITKREEKNVDIRRYLHHHDKSEWRSHIIMTPRYHMKAAKGDARP